MHFGVFDHIDSNGMAVGEQYEQRLALAERYDALGFYCYHLTEHHATELGRGSSPSVFLSAVAQRTRRMRIGTLIYILPLHHPVRLLEEIGMLDQLSGGRFQLGVGRGGQPAEHSRFGLAEEDLGPMFEEALEIVMQGLDEGRVAHEGRYWSLPETPLLIRPVQQPHPPLWYGTGSTHRNAWAAQHDVNLLCLTPNERSAAIFADYRDHLARLGKTGAKEPFIGLARQMVVADTDAEAERIAERGWAKFVQSFNWLVNRLGRPAAPIAPTYADAVKRGMAFAGSPASARDFVAEAHAAGANYMALELAFGDLSEAEVARSAELFAAEVMPAFAPADAEG
ncbi:LLM class flavin-dependent oxidoreductase [Altericroceibacterium xinjiangense]|uniref:LLM class flavin-dependent oxidoreductase n=1 Tax=Altericroceibacterium xinjiangense TaxID=762261 RepID=UPI0013E02A4B|nr:LLM class flavin-dependent oxidoreductase [Altericroceibacterium xinjiangense]